MKKWLIVLCLTCASIAVFPQISSTSTKAYRDNKGWLQIVTADGHKYTIRPYRWQSGGGFEQVLIAPDGKTVGWLADQMLTPLQGGTNYAYAVALELDIWRNGRVIRKFPTPALTIGNWTFLNGGDEVAFHLVPPHGMESYDCELFDVTTGRKLAHWALDRRDYVVPEWAKQLLVDDPFPGPDEISNWVSADPTPKQTSPSQRK